MLWKSSFISVIQLKLWKKTVKNRLHWFINIGFGQRKTYIGWPLMHNQPREPQPYEDCQAKSIQEFGWTSQGMDWGWGQGIKSHHTQTCQGIWLQLSSETSYLAKEKNWTVASGPKSSFQMRASFVFHLETKVLESGGRVEKLIPQVARSPVLSLYSLWWFGVQCNFLCHFKMSFWKPTSLHPFTKKFWSTSCFLLLTSFLKMLISFSSRIWHLLTLPKAPKVG